MSRQGAFYRPVHQAIAILFITLAILVMLAAAYSVRWIVIATLIGIGLGTLLVPVSETLHRRYRIPPAITNVLLLLALYGAVIAVVYFLIHMLSTEIAPLMQKLPDLVHGIQARFGHFFGSHPAVQKAGQQINIQKYFGSLAHVLLAGVKSGATGITALIYIFFVALYFSIRHIMYVEGFVSLFPEHLRSKTRAVVDESSESLRRWFGAQLIAMLIVAALAGIALMIVGSPYWLFFGAITFVLELVPYFGPLTALAVVCVVTAAAAPNDLLKTAIAFAIVLFLEGHVIIPQVMRGRAKLPPVHLLVLLTAMGEWFGIFGFLMAAPTLMVLRTVYHSAYLPMMSGQKRPPSESSAKEPVSPAA